MEYQAFYGPFWHHGVFWVLVAVVLFAIFAGRAIARAITTLLDARTEGVREALDEAARLKAEAEAMLAQAKAAQAQAAEDARTILASAHDQAERMAAELAADAQAAAKWRERMAMERIAAAEANAVKDVRAAAIDIATAAAQSILRESFSAEADSGMVDNAIAALPAALR